MSDNETYEQRRSAARELRAAMRAFRTSVNFVLENGYAMDRSVHQAWHSLRRAGARIHRTYAHSLPSDFIGRWHNRMGRLYAFLYNAQAGEEYSHIVDRTCPCCSTLVNQAMLLFDVGGVGERCIVCTDPDEHSVRYLDRQYEFIAYDEDEDSDERYLMGYGADPISEIGKPYLAGEHENVTETTRLFGCEIEFVVNSADGLAEITRDKDCRAIGVFKEDGSVPYPGGEFCLLPMTRKGAALHLQKPLDFMVKSGARAWNRLACGLHIHVTRASTTWTTWGKVDRFFGNVANSDFLTEIAGREPNGFCNRETFNRSTDMPVKYARDKTYGGANRYMALNFATGHPTVEFRLFRGNVAYGGVMRAIEFCDAIVNFAETQSNRSSMTAGDFQAWLVTQSKAYPYLVRYLRRRFKNEKTDNIEDAA